MCCNSAPDTSGINAAAQANADLGKSALDWYTNQYDQQAPLRQAASDRANAVSDAQLAAMQTATQQAQKDAAYREQTFQPLEKSIVADAQNYDTEARREQEAGRAIADVTQQSGLATDAQERSLARMGVNPSDGSFGAAANQRAIATAAAAAGAAGNARRAVETQGFARLMDAANLGRNLPSSQATQAGIALSAGNSAAGNAATPVNIATQGTNMVGQGYGTAINGNSSAGNLYGQAANIQNQANSSNNAAWGGLGSAAGGFLGNPALATMISDRNQKERKRPLKGEVALAAVNRMPVKKWAYKAISPANDGGKEHIGPMAQDVNAAMGEGAAPGGKLVNVGDVAGVTLAAVQHLSKKVDKLAAKRA